MLISTFDDPAEPDKDQGSARMWRELEKNMAEFLETWAPLRKYRKLVADELGNMARPSIHMYCHRCESGETFVNLGNQSHGGRHSDLYEWIGDFFEVMLARYLCAGCKKFGRLFILEKGTADGNQFIRKIGQKPDWEVAIEPRLARILGASEALFRRGVDCESSGYGIGALAYYRRVVEDILDELLDSIPPLLEGDEKAKYAAALAQTKATTVAKDKIALVKDLLPARLRRDGINPLEVLYEVLSDGLHVQSDEACLDVAGAARESLVFLIDELKRADEAQKRFTAGMRKFLNKRTENKGAKGSAVEGGG